VPIPRAAATRPLPLVVLLLLLPAPVAAQAIEASARATRVEAPPTIDGHLSDAVWASGEPITGFRQRDPEEGEPASEPTSVWILFDEVNLYIGARLDDGDAARIQANELRRDSDLDSDDTFAVILDTYRDRRNGFLFRVNPHGTRFDAIVRNEGQPDEDWTEEWRAEAAIDPTGWSVEIAIPFRSLRFNLEESGMLWGLNLQRVIRRKNEDAYWTNWSRDFDFEHVSQAGAMSGLERIRQGTRVRITPYVVGGAESLDATPAPQPTDGIGEVGIDDIKIAVTTNLTADIAVNPDFAQTEIDDQRVNLTRFSLFFPEKRQFFLEGAESLRMGPPGGEFSEDEALEMFHSRRIGLSDDGEPIPLIAGGKMTGKIHGVDLGLLAARTGKTALTVDPDDDDDENGGPALGPDAELPGETFGVLRFRREMFGRSYVGAIATIRDGAGDTNGALGLDARIVPHEQLIVSALVARTDDGTTEPQWAEFVGAEWDGDFFSGGAMYLDIDPEFDPGIGFVRRNDRLTKAGFSLGPRPSGGPIRQIEFGPEIQIHHDQEWTLITREMGFDVETEFQSGDAIEMGVTNIREDLPEEFEIEDGIVLPIGRYDWNEYGVSFNSYEGRAVTFEVGVDFGGFYNGTAQSLELSSDLRLGPHLLIGPEYEMNRISLVQGDFTTHLFGLRTDIAFTRDLLTSALFQYNSEGELAALQVRFNYIFRNIDNFYLVYNETRFTDGPFRNHSNRSLVSKLTYSIRF
jgi:hypothetical protein